MINKIFENNEVINSVKDSINEKINSPVYGVFIFSWLVVHWKFVYTALFVSEEKIWEVTGGMLKSDYLVKTFFNTSDFWFYILILLPFLLTWFFIWKFPIWISIPAFEKSQKNEAEKLKINFGINQSLLKDQLENTKLTEQKIKKEKEIKEQEKEIKKIDPIAEWLNEFQRINLNGKDVMAIRDGNRAIYETYGRFTSNSANINQGYNTYISPESLSRLDTLGLINFISDRRDVMEFTEKGKFFIRELQKRNIL